MIFLFCAPHHQPIPYELHIAPIPHWDDCFCSCPVRRGSSDFADSGHLNCTITFWLNSFKLACNRLLFSSSSIVNFSGVIVRVRDLLFLSEAFSEVWTDHFRREKFAVHSRQFCLWLCMRRSRSGPTAPSERHVAEQLGDGMQSFWKCVLVLSVTSQWKKCESSKKFRLSDQIPGTANSDKMFWSVAVWVKTMTTMSGI
jgi:hypothetical protein